MRGRFSILAFFFFFFLFVSTFKAVTIMDDDRKCSFLSCFKDDKDRRCSPSSCGKLRNISYPFRLKTDPKKCGFRAYTLSCHNNNNSNFTTLDLNSNKYIVEAINYNNGTIRIVDQNIYNTDQSSSSLPRYSLGTYNFTRKKLYSLTRIEPTTNQTVQLAESVIFLTCKNPILQQTPHLYIDASRGAWRKSERPFTYALVNGSLSVSQLPSSCRVELMTLVSSEISKTWSSNTTSFEEIRFALTLGIELSWERAQGFVDYGNRYINSFMNDENQTFLAIGGFLLAKLMYGLPFVLLFWAFIRRRRNFSKRDHIEQFLQTFTDQMPIRYSYSKLRKMSNGFKDSLGVGGYGSVYRGKLCSSGRLVAIKILDKSKSNGEDFVNEVATIGRIHHVNVVQLVGFCVEGSKRALVYDYMPMGSLDKHIFSDICAINREKMLEISQGVARGIEYLHRGCAMRILHFDIKPHNILLDESLVPKISDFGLARLCPRDRNTVSLTAARGTIGYIAPELFYKNIGGVSHKADVYSFGMLLMEMASRRKNLDPMAERTSQIYFPSWAFRNLIGEEEKSESESEDEEGLRKMVIVALWCTQMRPCERPSMSKVIEMLQGDVQSLQLPPKPSLCPQQFEPKTLDLDCSQKLS